jgi:hypothetical protein
MSAAPQYEFTNEQNALIGSLAGKMRFVGLFLFALGALNVLLGVLVLLAIYRTNVPPSWVNQLPESVKKAMENEKVPALLPPNNQLWGIAINAFVVGLFYLLMGSWTRSSAEGFQKIVDTQGRDISHLMNALGALHSMYALVYTLVLATLLISLLALGIVLYLGYMAPPA